MRSRPILFCGIALASLGLATAAHAQDSRVQRLASIVSVALEEYRLGVDSVGRVIAPTEISEARGFLTDARDAAAQLTDARFNGVRAIVDSIADAVEHARATPVVDALYERFIVALGPDAEVPMPSRGLDAAAGHALFSENCASCHGTSGIGDGPGAKGLNPPPAALAGASARAIAPGLMYRIVSVGVKGTAMASWSDKLTSDQRWNIVAYVSSLRAGAATAAATATATASANSARATAVTSQLDSAVAAMSAGHAAVAVDRAVDAYAAFEPLESAARARNGKLVSRVEGMFLEFRTAVRGGDAVAARNVRERIAANLPSVLALASAPASVNAPAMVAQAFIVILREGFEAILIIGAIVAMLVRTGHGDRTRDVWLGSAVGLAASVATAFVLHTVLAALPLTSEVLEGATLLVAVVVLFWVSYWILSKVDARRWQAFVHDRVHSAIARGGRATLMSVAFLVVYREGAETVLFFQALLQQSAHTAPVFAGLAAGAAALVAVYVLFQKFGVRMPLRPFFAATGGLLYLMAFVFVGKGVRELQEGAVVGVTPVHGVPTIDALGVYPSVETLVGQWLLLGLFALACWSTFVAPRLSAHRDPQPVTPVPDSAESTTR